MDKLDLILQKVNALQNMMAAMFVLLAIFMTGVVMYLRDFKDRHTIQNLTKTGFQIVTNLVSRTTKHIKNMGTVEPIPDIPDELKIDFFQKWVKRGKMDFKETECLPLWGGSDAMYRKFMDWCASEKIIKRKVAGVTKGPNSAWVAADKRGTMIRINQILNQSTAGAGKTLKQM